MIKTKENTYNELDEMAQIVISGICGHYGLFAVLSHIIEGMEIAVEGGGESEDYGNLVDQLRSAINDFDRKFLEAEASKNA